MADIKDWGKFIRGRWDWKRYGYEKNFPRGCGFTDVDAAIEFDGRHLVIETKDYDGEGIPGEVPIGQLQLLRADVRCGKAVLVLWGCACCNDPYILLRLGPDRPQDQRFDWRGEPREWRRAELKRHIDEAMGVGGTGSRHAS